MRNSKNILQHELIGLKCKVVGSENKSQVGVQGKVIDETMKTLIVESKQTRKRIAKAGSKFKIWLPKSVVEIDGNAILARPEDRIKKIVHRW